MEFLGIGPLELLLIFVLALILLGPKEMVSTAKKAAEAIRKVTKSDFWKEAVDSSREIRQLPNQIMKDTGLDEELRKINRDLARNQDQVKWEQDMEKARNPVESIGGQTEVNKDEKKGDSDGGS
jgi:Sec-independent protein translocase protein TatA